MRIEVAKPLSETSRHHDALRKKTMQLSTCLHDLRSDTPADIRLDCPRLHARDISVFVPSGPYHFLLQAISGFFQHGSQRQRAMLTSDEGQAVTNQDFQVTLRLNAIAVWRAGLKR